jgi:hypothetical protein
MRKVFLVSIKEQERATIDFNLSFNGDIFNPNLAIIELKQEKLRRSSPMFQILKKRGIHPNSISKYCIGISEMHPDIKQNFFKRKKLIINKITSQ